MSELRPISPCIKVCVLDAAARCTGCGRTIDEIVRWGGTDEDDRKAVMAQLPERMARLGRNDEM